MDKKCMVKKDSLCFRYVVPFYYDIPFKDAVKEADGREGCPSPWERNTASDDGPESDLFSSIKNEFRFPDGNDISTREGVSWNRRKPAAGARVQSGLLFFRKSFHADEKEMTGYTGFDISDAGLYLFRNSLGLFWYEITIKKEELSLEEVIEFQSVIKELNRTGDIRLWKQSSGDDPEAYLEYKKKGNDKKIHELYYVPFSIGDWIAGEVDFLKPVFLPDRKNGLNSNDGKSGEKYQKVPEKDSEVLKIIKDKAKAYKSREKAARVPDKALIFGYMCLGENAVDTEDMKKTAYHIANGYNLSYAVSDDTLSHSVHPFENVVWYASRSGASVVSSGSGFFASEFKGRFKESYYAMYIKNLYQSYSMFLYSQKIDREIPADISLMKDGALFKKVSELYSEINLYMTKGTSTSVSHIDHQNDFYNYLKKRLLIDEDTKSVTEGLFRLDALLKDNNDRKTEKRQNFHNAIISIITALLGLNFIEDILLTLFR